MRWGWVRCACALELGCLFPPFSLSLSFTIGLVYGRVM